MSRIVIDGYNLLAQSPYQSRDELLTDLKNYQRSQKHEITIFFDGTHQGTGTGDKYFEEYVEIIFTPLTVTADDMIEEYIEKNQGTNMIVVSSDRRIQKAATASRHSFLEVRDFLLKMKSAPDPLKTVRIPPWMEGRTTDEEDYGPKSSKKKGNPKQKSKNERNKIRTLKKI